MEHKYIFLKDSGGCENLWKIIHETNVAYIINRCENTSVVLKDTCFNKSGSILYSSAVRDFDLVSYEESDESYLKYLGKDIFEPYYPNEEEQTDYYNSYIDVDDEGNLYEILSLDYLKELEYNMYDDE